MSQKVKRGRQESLLKGQYVGGFIPFGYAVADKRWIVQEQEADIVRTCFEQYASGEKAQTIVDSLNARGIHNKTGKPVTLNSVTKLLRNRKYRGEFASCGQAYTDVIPAIVSAELFDRCNAILDGHKHRQRECTACLFEPIYCPKGRLLLELTF